MPKRRQYGGFSLVEVLLAVATLAIGMMFIGGTFLAGVYLSTVSTERTMATVVANEAFSKIKLFGVDMADPNLADPKLAPPWQKLFDYKVKPLYVPRPIDPGEFAYPSTRTLADKQYFWSALCRRDPDDPNHALLVTVFVSRKVGTATQYAGPGPGGSVVAWAWPVPMPIRVAGTIGSRVLTIEAGRERWIGEGYTIVEDGTGQKYRVVERGVDPAQVLLDPDTPWLGGNLVWAVPPPLVRLTPLAVGGGGPCIAVYQTEIRF